MTIRERTIETAALTVGLLEAGPADGPLVLCLHGFPDTAWTWRHLLPALGEAGYRAVAPFLRGYAPTAAPVEPHRGVATYVDDAAALVDALRPAGPVALVGHDWGAVIAYVLADRLRGRIAAAVTIAVPPTGGASLDLSTWGQARRSWYSFLLGKPLGPELLAAGDLALVERLWRDWSPGFDPAVDVAHVRAALATPERIALAAAPYAAEVVTRVPAGFPGAGPTTRADIGAPLLYLHGQDDGCMGVDVVEHMRPAFPIDGTAVLLDGCGHFLQLERPEEVERLVLPFLAERAPTA